MNFEKLSALISLSLSLFMNLIGLVQTPRDVQTARGHRFKRLTKPHIVLPMRGTFLVWEQSGTIALSKSGNASFPGQMSRSSETRQPLPEYLGR